MPRNVLLGSLLASAMSLANCLAATPPENVAASSWIADLSAGAPAVRDAARRKLLDLNTMALPALAQALAERPMADHTALRELIDEIERAAIAARLNGRRVSWPPRDRALGESLAQLSGETGFPIQLSDRRLATRRTHHEFSDAPFWEVLDALCREAQTGWDWGQPPRTIEISGRRPADEASAVDGAFRAQAALLSRGRPFAPPAAGDIVRLTLRIDVEPDVIPYYVRAAVGAIQATPDQRERLQPFSPDARRELPFDEQRVEIAVDFVRGASPAFPSATISGEVEVFCAAEAELLEIPLSGEPAAFWAGRTSVTREAGEQVDGAVVVALRVIFPAEIHWESYQEAQLHREASLRWPDGREQPFTERELTGMSGREQLVRYRFPLPDDAAGAPTLLFRAPALLTTRTVAFAIPDVPVTD